MSNNSIIEHRGNYHFVPLREEYLTICMNCAYHKQDTDKSKNKASPYCKAFILAIMEGWTNDKRGESSLAVFMTYRQWQDSMYGMFGRNVIIDSLDELIGEHLIAREPYKMYGKDTFQYYLNYREVNRRIKALPERAPNQKLPQMTYDPFTSKPDEDEDTDVEVNPTHLQINATRLQVNASHLLVNADPFTSNHNIDTSKKHRDIEKERETPTVTQQAPSSSLSLSQEKSSSLLASFTDKQADFWTRWQAIAGAQKLNETAYEHVVTLAETVSTTQVLQSLYDFTYDLLKELARASGKEAIPPRLGNLVKCQPEWEQAQKRRTQEHERGHVSSGTAGRLTNFTDQWRKENAPPVVYDPQARPKKQARHVGGFSKPNFGDIAHLCKTVIRPEEG